MKLPIDTSALRFLCAVAPEPVIDFDSKRPKTDESGAPLYAVQLVVLADGGAEVITAKVAGEPKGVTAGATVRVVGLVANPWAMGERSGVAYRAERIEPMPAQRAA